MPVTVLSTAELEVRGWTQHRRPILRSECNRGRAVYIRHSPPYPLVAPEDVAGYHNTEWLNESERVTNTDRQNEVGRLVTQKPKYLLICERCGREWENSRVRPYCDRCKRIITHEAYIARRDSTGCEYHI